MASRTARTFSGAMQTSYRVCVGLCSLLAACTGCGKAHPVQDRPEADAATDAKTYLPGSIHGQGWHIPWRGKNLKHPNGPPVKILIADAKEGSMVQQDDNIVLRLQHVRTKLFHNGKPAALVQADEVTTNRKSEVVIGTGHVIVTSLTNPPDTVITADKMTWDRNTNRVIAIGNVHARQRKPNGQPSTDSYSDRMEYDLTTGKLKG